MPGKLFITVLRFFPKKTWSRCLSVLVRTRFPRPINLWIMRTFVRRYQLDLTEASLPLEEYPTIGALFTRTLKPDTHNIDMRAKVAVSPADGHVLNSGRLREGQLIQCKGRDFDIADLLVHPERAGQFREGSWCTVYLSPRDYHRVHHPIEGSIVESQYITGQLWPVNQAAVDHVKNLFCVNERVVTYVESPLGMVATIMVGATSVGHISMAYDESIVANKGHKDSLKSYTPSIEISRAAELGTFHLGSTAIVLFADPSVEVHALADGQEIRIGDVIASYPNLSTEEGLIERIEDDQDIQSDVKDEESSS
jgi:phosphatidylserine decarboxylase